MDRAPADRGPISARRADTGLNRSQDASNVTICLGHPR